jgi:hypothetical protein
MEGRHEIDRKVAEKQFELENEIMEEEIYKFSEAEQDKLFETRPWRKEYSNIFMN